MIKCTICENYQRAGKKHTCSKCKNKNYLRRNAGAVYRVLPIFLYDRNRKTATGIL